MNSVYTTFEPTLIKQSDKIAFQYFHKMDVESITFSDAHKQIINAANKLQQLKLEPGDRVAIVIENSPLWVITFMALMRLSLTAVLIDPSLPTDDMAAEIQFSDVRCAILSKFTKDIKLEKAMPSLPIVIADENFALLNNDITPMNLPARKNSDPNIVIIIFTSGTTGKYKAVMLTAENFLYVTTYKPYTDILVKTFTIIPCYHIAGIQTLCTTVFGRGSTICLVEKLEPDIILRTFNEAKPFNFLGVPRILEIYYSRIMSKLNEQSAIKRFTINSLISFSGFLRRSLKINLGPLLFKKIHDMFGGKVSVLLVGGAPINQNIRFFFENIGFNVLHGYGLSETTGTIVLTNLKHKIPNTIGEPMDGCKIKIDSPNEEGIGEICIQSPSVMKGYFKNPEETAASIKEGWFHTGDLGYLDSYNNLEIVGRLKEVIVTDAGKKVTPGDIERHYQDIPGVAEYVVVGYPNPTSKCDDVYGAVIVDKNYISSEMSEEELQHSIINAFAIREGSLPSQYRIHHIEFFDDFPRTTGAKKIIRNKIIKEITRRKSVPHHAQESDKIISKELKRALDSVVEAISKVILIPQNDIEPQNHCSEYLSDSLLALEVVQRLRKKYSEQAVSLETLFKNPTIVEFAEDILERINSPQEEVVKSSSIVPPRVSPTPAQFPTSIPQLFKSDVVFVTGGTGVLGGYLVKLLLTDTNKTVYLLTRAKTQAIAKTKLVELLNAYETSTEALAKIDTNIKFLLGDVSEEFFGLSENEYHKLQNRVDVVIHAAAIISLHGLYESLVPVNVVGTQHAIDFALGTKQKYMVYVSSYSMMGNIILDKNPDFTEHDFDREQTFHKMGYQQTKFEAEYLVRTATEKGLKWNIVRPGDIFGDSKTGSYPLVIPQFTGIFYDLLRTVIYTKVAVNSKVHFDVTPVDYASRGLLYIGLEHPAIYGTYHLTNPSTRTYSHVIECIKNIGYPIEETTLDDYMNRLVNQKLLHKGKPYKSRTLELLQFNPIMVLSTATTHVGTEITQAVLEPAGIVCPKIDETLMKTYLDYCKKVNFMDKNN